MSGRSAAANTTTTTTPRSGQHCWCALTYTHFFVFLVLWCASTLWTWERLLFVENIIHNNEATTTSRSSSVNSRQILPIKIPVVNGIQDLIRRKQDNYDKIIHWKGKDDLKIFMKAYFNDRNKVCDLFPIDKGSNERIVHGDDGADERKENNSNSKNEEFKSKILLNITFGCQDLFQNAGAGSGNFIVGFYAIRLAAAALSSSTQRYSNVQLDVAIDCDDALEERHQLLLPWITGFFPSGSGVLSLSSSESSRIFLNNEQQQQQHNKYQTILERDVCKNIDYCPIGFQYRDIQYELRRMAISLVGIPHDLATAQRVKDWWQQQQLQGQQIQQQRQTSTTIGSWYYKSVLKLPLPPAPPLLDDQSLMQQQQYHQPLFRNVSLDDIVVHFRCGDLMASNHPRFAFLKYSAFAKPIREYLSLSSSSSTKVINNKKNYNKGISIGIVTQPFEQNAQSRSWDASAVKRERCRTVVLDFQSYLNEQFMRPHPKREEAGGVLVRRIQIHNDPNETIALTYARLIVADLTIAGISTFGVFPSIASFGTGYIRRPDQQSPTNQWLTNPRMDELICYFEEQHQKQSTINDIEWNQKQLVLMEEPNLLMVRKVQEIWNQDPNAEQTILQWFRNDSVRYTMSPRSSS